MDTYIRQPRCDNDNVRGERIFRVLHQLKTDRDRRSRPSWPPAHLKKRFLPQTRRLRRRRLLVPLFSILSPVLGNSSNNGDTVLVCLIQAMSRTCRKRLDVRVISHCSIARVLIHFLSYTLNKSVLRWDTGGPHKGCLDDASIPGHSLFCPRIPDFPPFL